MRRFVNLYIFFFILDAGFSLVDELTKISEISVPFLSDVQFILAKIVIALSMIIYACLGLDRHLPKKLLMPMALYIFWNAFGLWPLAGVFNPNYLALLAALGQLSLLFCLVLLRRGRLFLAAEQFPKGFFSIRNTLSFAFIHLLLSPFILVYTGLASASLILDQQTGGYIRISPVGIYMTERTYYGQGKKIRLAGMIHIGQKEYYNSLAVSFSGEKAVILVEGVTDRNGLLKHRFDYGQLAKLLGLSSQELMRIEGTPTALASIGHNQASNKGKPDIVHADVDVNQFDPQTIAFLNAFSTAFFGDQPLNESLEHYNAWINQNMAPEQIDIIMDDILNKRNEVVINTLIKVLPYYQTIVIPWGAMHMPAIERAVIEQGYRLEEDKERLSVDFRRLPYKDLWRSLPPKGDSQLPASG